MTTLKPAPSWTAANQRWQRAYHRASRAASLLNEVSEVSPSVSAWPEFGQPAWLLLLPTIPLVIVWWLRRRPASLRFSSTAVAAAINTRRGTVARWFGALARGLALAALVVALAGPRWPDPGSRIPTEGIAVLLI